MAVYKRYNRLQINVRKGLDYSIVLNVGETISQSSDFSGATVSSRAESRISEHYFDIEVVSTSEELAAGKIVMRINGASTENADETQYICDIIETRGSQKRIINTLVIDVTKRIIAE